MLSKGKRLAIVLAITVLALTLIGVLVSATAEPSVEIRLNNLSYTQNVVIKYALEVNNLPSGATVGVKVERNGDVSEATFAEIAKINGKEYYIFDVDNLVADEMTVDVYATPYIAKADGSFVYGSQKKSSVLEYSYKIMGKIEGGVPVADSVKELLACMLDYGAAVQLFTGKSTDRLATDDFYQVKLVDGSFADGFAKGLYKQGDTLTPIADAPDRGFKFSGWRSSVTGSLIKDSTITVGATNVIYTAEYEDARNLGKISYNLDGGTLPEGAQDKYDKDANVAYVLPIPEKSGYLFSGWYTSASLNGASLITEIPADATADYSLYAKWNKIISEINSTNIGTLDLRTNDTSTVTAVSHPVSGKPVIYWQKTATTAASTIANMGNLTTALDGARRLTLTVTLSAPASGRVSPCYLALKSANTTYDTGSGSIILQVDDTGAIILGTSRDNYISSLGSDPVTISVVVDFDAGELTAYNALGARISTAPFNRGGASSASDWLSTMKYYNWVFTMKSAATGSIYVHDVSLYGGDSVSVAEDTGYTYDELSNIVSALLAEKNSFTDSDFDDPALSVKSLTMNKSKWKWQSYGSGGVMRSTWGILDSASPYALTKRSGTAANDARLMINNDTLDNIIANMSNPEYADALAELLAIAKIDCDGVLIDPMVSYNSYAGNHNYDPRILAIIEAKALVYRIMYEQNFAAGTPEALERDMYGYQAIIAIKNYLKTFKVETYVGDESSRYYGKVMHTAAEVYDWCKPLLTAADKHQIILGVVERCCAGTTADGSRNKMSVNYPPVSDQTFTGHSSEMMVLRDYLSFAIAIYDDDPTWYNYIASGILTRFVPGRVYYFQSGMTHQGVSNYVEIRHMGDLYAAWMLQVATGENPFTGIENTMISVLGHQHPDEIGIFEDGDGNNPSIRNYSSLVLMASAICELGGFGDNADTLYTWFYELNGGFDTHFRSSLYDTSYATFFVFALQGQEMNADKYEGLDPIQYNGYPLGQMISRAEWGNPDAAAVFVKIKERHASNHEQEDAGTFQIYYKGLLTGDTGVYGSTTSSDHYTAYHTATLAHNGILVYDKSNTDPLYTGGQRSAGLGVNHGVWENWLDNVSDNYDAGTVTGVQYGYKDAAQKQAKYAYVAGDITVAYDTTSQVNHVERRTLTVYTDNADFPMVFFVYDDVEAKGAGFETKFLLHVNTPDAPTVSGNTVTISNGEGKLVLTCLAGSSRIDSLGGRVYDASGKYDAKTSSNYLIGGTQVYDSTLKDDGAWGRVEIVSTEKATKMMNVIYVTDAGQTKTAPAISGISGTNVQGGVFGNVAAVFMTSRTRVTTAQSFTVSGSGTMEYYVSGVAAGTWTVSVGGTTKTVTATEDGGLLVFTAPAGTVTITPAK